LACPRLGKKPKTIDCFLKITYIKKITDTENGENTSHIDVNQESGPAEDKHGRKS
jgi:hypothetical protein